MPSVTPMLDKVRQYAKDWGVGIVGDRSGMSGTANLELRPDSFPFTHDGPGIFSIHWPTRTIVEPIATVAKRKRVATDSDAWYLIHEISHILLNVDPEEVDEIASAIIALDYHAGRHLGLTGWDDWMGDFTLPEMEMVERQGHRLLSTCEWRDVGAKVQAHLLEQSLGHAIAKGLLTEDGTPTFNRAAWMPASMLVERAATRLLRVAMLETSR